MKLAALFAIALATSASAQDSTVCQTAEELDAYQAQNRATLEASMIDRLRGYSLRYYTLNEMFQLWALDPVSGEYCIIFNGYVTQPPGQGT